MNPLETGRHPMTVIIIIIINPLTARVVGATQMILQPVFTVDSVHDVLVNKKSNAMLVFILFSTGKQQQQQQQQQQHMYHPSVSVSPKFFHLISQSPRMFHLYLSISCVDS